MTAPAPPPGPGVAPPFAAPPTEGRRTRLWIGLGVGALAVVLCCGGGGTAVVGLAVSGVQAIREQARTVTGDYYQALVERDYERAYEQLCDDAQRRESRPEFERRASAEPQVAAFRVGEVDTTTLTVPVDVTLAGGDRDQQQVSLGQDGETGGVEVCGVS
ncbi:Rv0361 family membrane protein [Micromonospora zamorensis]|uniref:Rv0361 family membrane protein n=1 Tax=Micromonospora zamorensis TaxID=709883 RepID=UPI00379371CD